MSDILFCWVHPDFYCHCSHLASLPRSTLTMYGCQLLVTYYPSEEGLIYIPHM